jgi:hypothetical protein
VLSGVRASLSQRHLGDPVAVTSTRFTVNQLRRPIISDNAYLHAASPPIYA